MSLVVAKAMGGDLLGRVEDDVGVFHRSKLVGCALL